MLTINNLYKEFGNFKALNGVNIELEAGEIYGFIGPNGAGKSTTMKIVAGLLSADQGEVYIDGINALKFNKVLKEKIGYMPDYIGVYDNLKVIEYLEFFGSIYGIKGKESKRRGLELLDLVRLSEKSNAYIEILSRGMKQRLSLARAMMHDPEVLILDEPASGMDPRARYEMKNILKNLKSLNKTVLVSSHILSELGEICDRVGIIDRGVVITQGTLGEVMKASNSELPIVLTIVENFDKAINLLYEYQGVSNITSEGNKIMINISGGDKETYELMKHLTNEDIIISSFSKKEGSLEELFIKLTSNEVVEEEQNND